MPELMREIASRLRDYVGNRRRAPRRRARLAVAVSLLDSRARAHPSFLEGHTRDLSRSGLALILPAIRIGDRYLTGESQTLRVTLRLPTGAIQLYATAVRYERLEEPEGACTYLIGARIKEMSDQDRARFDSYFDSLRK